MKKEKVLQAVLAFLILLPAVLLQSGCPQSTPEAPQAPAPPAPTQTFTNTHTYTFTPTGSYTLTPTFTPTLTPTFTVTFTRTLTPTPTGTWDGAVRTVWRVNAGGFATVDGQGNNWSADTNFSGGTANTTGNSIAGPNGTTLSSGDQALYKSERWSNNFNYVFNMSPGTYQVTLKFAEIYAGTMNIGGRVFAGSINGGTGANLGPLDIFYTVGSGDEAYDVVFNNISPVNGQIIVAFGQYTADNPKISAIQIIPQSSAQTPTATATPPCSTTFGNYFSGTSNLFPATSVIHSDSYIINGPATLSHLMAYLTYTPGSIRMALYTDNAGTPQNLLRQTASYSTLKNGWNDLPLTAPVTLASTGVYWIALQTTGGNEVRSSAGNAGQYKNASFTYGPFPGVFPVPTFTSNTNYLLAGYKCP